MTTTEPQRLLDGLCAALDTWAAPARERLPLAVFCAEPHPLDEAILCRHLDGHAGPHGSDREQEWPTT